MVTTRSRVTRKGQVTIPAPMRAALGIEEGTPVEFEQQGQTVVLRKAKSVTEQTAGSLSKYRKPHLVTPQEEHDAFVQGVAEEADDYPGRW